MRFDSRLLRLAQSQRLLLSLAILLGVSTGVLIVLQARLMSGVIAQVFLSMASLNQVVRGLIFILLLVTGRWLVTWLGEVSARTAAANMMGGMRQRMFNHLYEIGPVHTRGESSGELVSVFIEGVNALDAYFSQYLPQVALAALIPLTYLILIFPLDPLSGSILLLTAPLIPIFMVLVSNLAEAVTQRQWKTLQQMGAFYLDILQGLTTLKILGQSKAMSGKITEVNERYWLATIRVLRVTFLSALTLEMIATLSTAVVAVEIGLRLLYGRLDFEQAFFILLLAPEFYLPLRMLGSRFHAGMTGIAAAGRIFEILGKQDRGMETGDRGNRGIAPFPSTKSNFMFQPGNPPTITFQDVSFAYTAGRPVLQGITFTIPAGKTVALMGKSGSGKSTLAGLLMGFIDAERGTISITNSSTTIDDPRQWQGKIIYLPQTPYLFNASVEENIRLGKPQASADEVTVAARLAHADEFIRALPNGYQTRIGDRGARLSGGEAQRIALARAFLMNAEIVILDEPAVNLDPVTEAMLAESVEKLLENRTALVITHRLETARRADFIFQLDEGRIVTHPTQPERLRESPKTRLVVNSGLKFNKQDPDDHPDFHDEMKTSPPLQPGHNAVFTKTVVFGWLVSFLRPHILQVALSVLLGFLTVASGVGLMAVSAYLISTAALAPSIADLQVAIVLVRTFGISRGVFRYLERLSSHQVTLKVLGELRVSFYNRLEPLAPARMMSYRGGDFFRRISGDIHQLEGFYVRAIAPGLTAVLVGLVVGCFLGWFSWFLGLVLWAGLLFAGIGLPLVVHALSRNEGRHLVQTQADYASFIIDSMQGMADIFAYNAQKRMLDRNIHLNEILVRTRKHLAGIDTFQQSFVVLIANLCGWLVLVLAIPLVEDGVVPGVMLAALVIAATSSFEAILPLPQAAHQLGSDLTAGERLLEVISTQPQVTEPVEIKPVPRQFELQATGIHFRYPSTWAIDLRKESSTIQQVEGEKFALRGVSFNLAPGKRIAIVGASGAGKSTIANLILRFWDIQDGEISIEGEDLRCFRSERIRERVGVVSQNTYLFNTSIGENLLLAKPQATPAEIEKVLETSQLTGWVSTLPEGLETPVGELGMQVSGGERQRIAIARALLKNPALLILDEPTANLDEITGTRILDEILALNGNATMLLITHKVTRLEKMDEIIVLHEGEIIEQGTQEKLLEKDRYFRRMLDLQRGGFGSYQPQTHDSQDEMDM